MKNFLILSLIAIAVSSCKGKEDTKSNLDYVVQGDTIVVSEKSSLLGKLKTINLDLEIYCPYFTTSGVVKAIPTNYAEIASPFSGRITRSFVRLGQKVEAGSPIFEISSPAFFETTKTYYQAKQEMDLALKSLKRENDLFNNKVGVEKEKEEAELNYELKKKDYENARAALLVYRINPSQLSLGHPLIVRSPIAGEVVKSNIVLGQYMKDDAEPVAIVANLDMVWVVAHVKEKDIRSIQNLSEVEITLVAMPEKTIKGKIYHISDMMDEETRSVEVLIECKNSDRQIKPGMYGTVKLTDKPKMSVILPTSSVLQQENNSYVLVDVGKNRYVKREITAISTTDNRLVVLSGLNKGEKVITEGAFYLNDVR